MLDEAKQVCPTTTRRLVNEGALLVDVREAAEVARLAFDVPAIQGAAPDFGGVHHLAKAMTYIASCG